MYWLETFIDPARFNGTCYRAANLLCLGSTTGRWHNARTKKRTQPVKDLFGLPSLRISATSAIPTLNTARKRLFESLITSAKNN